MAWVIMSLVNSLSLSTHIWKNQALNKNKIKFMKILSYFTSQHKLQEHEGSPSSQARFPAAPTLITSCQNVRMLYAEIK